VANWLVGALALLAFLILGRPLLLPLVFALLIWAILNAIADALVRFNVPRWVAWTGSLALLLVGIYLLTLIIGNEAAQLAADAPGYVAKLQDAIVKRLAPLRIGINIEDVFTRSDLAGLLTVVAGSLGSSAFGLIQVLIYLGFLLAEQNDLAAKIVRLQRDDAGRVEGQAIMRRIAAQLQA